MSRKARQLKSAALKQQIIKLLSKMSKHQFTAFQISRKLNVSNPVSSIQYELDKLCEEGFVLRKRQEYYQWQEKDIIHKKSSGFQPQIYQGYVDMTRSGAAYITGTNQQDDIYVAPKYIKGALHKDLVAVELLPRAKRRKPEGKIVEILERSIHQIIGTIRKLHHYAVVTADEPKQFPEVHIKLSEITHINDGQKVRIEISDWGKGQNTSIWGKVLDVLDEHDENEIAMQSILLSNGFEIDFSQEALSESLQLHTLVNESETSSRKDFRQITTFTIDPATAKDFDDALSIRTLENHKFEIGVHIADVSHFLQEDSDLDKEAYKRATSVYLADRVCPMLPEVLSNELCSLNPNEDKYTFSAVFEMDLEGNVYHEWFGKTIIHSDRRFSYEEAQERIETNHGDFATEINILNTIALALRKERYSRGSISFESEEIQFEYDDHKRPISVRIKERKEAHMMIEDFMLLANKRVAEFIAKRSQQEIPFVYRVHDTPNPDKLIDFAKFAAELGFKFNLKDRNSITQSFNKLADLAKTNELLRLLEPLAIRTMAKAEYTTDNIGHYGLGFDFYTHFTSPIRRYSDVLSHRILYKNLTEIYRVEKESLKIKSRHISLQERKAMDAERESVKYKMAEFMMKFIGQELEGIVTGMSEKGIYIEIPGIKAEGFVAFEGLPDSYYVTESRYKAISRFGGNDILIGAHCKVKVIRSDKSTRKIDMELISE